MFTFTGITAFEVILNSNKRISGLIKNNNNSFSTCRHITQTEQNVGGGKIYGEYNKGPVKVGGEWNFDEEDQSVGWYDDQPSHTKPHMPDGNSMGNWINFRL